MVDAKRQKTVLPNWVLGRVGNIFIVASMPMQSGPWRYLLLANTVIYRPNLMRGRMSLFKSGERNGSLER